MEVVGALSLVSGKVVEEFFENEYLDAICCYNSVYNQLDLPNKVD